MPASVAVRRPADQLLLRQRARLEERLHQRVVGFGHHLDRALRAPTVAASSQRRGGTVALRRLAAAVGGERQAFIDTRSTTPVKSLLLADRQLDRHDRAAAEVAKRAERALEARALAIQPVDDDDAREAERLGFGPDLLGLHFDAGDGVHDDAARRRRRASAARASVRKLPMPGVSMRLILVLFHSAPGERGREGVLAGDFFVVVVGDRRAVVDPAEPGRGAGGEQERSDQLGLARAAVPTTATLRMLPVS